jgi:hypothetical protein
MGRSILTRAIPALILHGIILASFEYQVTLAVLVSVLVVGIVL